MVSNVRTPIQISVSECECHTNVVALCNDGTMWIIDQAHDDEWEKLPDIPQDKE